MGWNWQCAVGVYRKGGLEGKSAMIERKYIILRTTCLGPVTLTLAPFEVDIRGGIFSSCGLCTRFRRGEAKRSALRASRFEDRQLVLVLSTYPG